LDYVLRLFTVVALCVYALHVYVVDDVTALRTLLRYGCRCTVWLRFVARTPVAGRWLRYRLLRYTLFWLLVCPGLRWLLRYVYAFVTRCRFTVYTLVCCVALPGCCLFVVAVGRCPFVPVTFPVTLHVPVRLVRYAHCLFAPTLFCHGWLLTLRLVVTHVAFRYVVVPVYVHTVGLLRCVVRCSHVTPFIYGRLRYPYVVLLTFADVHVYVPFALLVC